MFMLRELRKSRGLTMKQLGNLIGQSESSIGLYEKERRKPDYETLLKLGEVLGCSVDSLLGNTYALTPQEETILFLFRLLNHDGREQAIQILTSLSKSSALSEKNSANTDVSAS